MNALNRKILNLYRAIQLISNGQNMHINASPEFQPIPGADDTEEQVEDKDDDDGDDELEEEEYF